MIDKKLPDYAQGDAALALEMLKQVELLMQSRPKRRRWSGGMPTPGREHE